MKCCNINNNNINNYDNNNNNNNSNISYNLILIPYVIYIILSSTHPSPFPNQHPLKFVERWTWNRWGAPHVNMLSQESA